MVRVNVNLDFPSNYSFAEWNGKLGSLFLSLCLYTFTHSVFSYQSLTSVVWLHIIYCTEFRLIVWVRPSRYVCI